MYPYTNDTLDPKIDYAQLMRSGIGEALFKCDENLKIQPWLAESYTGSADSTEYTITLKKGIKFSNGKRLRCRSRPRLVRTNDQRKQRNAYIIEC